MSMNEVLENITIRPAMNHPQGFKEIWFFGLRVHSVTLTSLLAYIDSSLISGRTIVIYGYSLTIVPKIKESREIVELGNSFDVMIPDGKGFFWLVNYFGGGLEEHLSLPDLVEHLLDHSTQKNHTILLFGATKEVNDNAQKYIVNKYGNIKAVYGIDGYFDKDQEDKILNRIKELSPDIVLIGISSPKKEYLAIKLNRILPKGVIVPCGGVIDILGGKTRREPWWVKQLGMTWIYRFIQEPRRLLRPVFLNGLYFLFVLLPILIWRNKILKDTTFTFQKLFRTPL